MDSGPIGGDMSHEFLILADTGESEVFCHKDILSFDVPGNDVDYRSDLQPVVDKWTSLYAATDEKHNAAKQDELGDELVAAGDRSGHIFLFRNQVFQSHECHCGISRRSGNPRRNGLLWHWCVPPLSPASLKPLMMKTESSGPNPSRLLGPVLLIFQGGDATCDTMCEDLYSKIASAGLDPLYDDRDERAGVKFANMDLIGLPWQVVVGPRGLENGMVEIKNRATGNKQEMTPDAVLNKLTAV